MNRELRMLLLATLGSFAIYLVTVAALPTATAARRTDPRRLVRDVNRGTPELAKVELVNEHRVNANFVVRKFRFSNGLAVIVAETHRAPVFAYQTWFRVGSRHEKKGRTGIAHLFEHLLFKETKNLKDGEFDKIMERNGAVTNAATWLDWTFYRENLPKGKLELVARLEADRMQNMVLNARQLKSEREVVKNERRLRVDNDPDGKLSEVLYATTFLRHPYGWPTVGWMADLDAITLEDCIRFYRTYYSPNNATVVVVGDVESEAVLKAIRLRYGHLKRQSIPKEKRVVEPQPTKERSRTLHLALSAPKIVIGYRSPALGDKDHAAVMVLNEVLFGGKSGRLQKLLVQDRELARSTQGWVAGFRFEGIYEMWFELKKSTDPKTVETLVARELQRISSQPISARELQKARNALEISLTRGLGSVGTIARQLGHFETTVGDYRTFSGSSRATAR